MSRLTKISIDSVLYDIGSKGINSYSTLSEMASEQVANLDDGAICWCKEDEKYYQWLSSNEVISVYARWRELDMGGTADKVTYENAEYPDLTNVELAIDKILEKIYYVKPSCSLSAVPAGGTFEIGTTIAAPIEFTWNINKDIITQTLTDCVLADETVRTATYDTDITSDKTFTLSVSDGENSATSSVSYKFMNNVFWGSAVEPADYDSAFILGLANKKLATSSKADYNFNCGSGEYAYWAVPTSLTFDSVWVNGFQADIEKITTISFENSKGYSTNYDILRLGNEGLGSFTATVK